MEKDIQEVLFRAWLIEPGMFQYLLGEGSFLGVAVEHGGHEGLEKCCLFILEAVSVCKESYLAIMTSLSDQFWSLGMRLREPSLVMYFLAFYPRMDIFFGNLPISYII